jgi:hypothetical protein
MAPTGCSEHPVHKVRAGISALAASSFSVSGKVARGDSSRNLLAPAGTTAIDPNQ